MRRLRRIDILTVLVLLVIATLRPAQSQTPATSAETIGLDDPLPLDPAIVAARLPNGLRYFVRTNRAPAHRAELRLVVNAGSVFEDDNQRGLAHFVEHMAFEGTTHFPGQSAIAFMQSLGMSVGAHVNATTSFDDTVYKLQVPTDRPEVLDRAFLILEDWAHAVTFAQAGVDRERGVVTSEWRQSLGAASRIQDQQFPILLQGSRYADRLPIGHMDVVQRATPGDLRAFYTDWYRPDLMAVIAVGDFDQREVAGMIRTHFAPLANPVHERPVPAIDVPAERGTRFAIATDPEVTATNVGVYDLAPAPDPATVRTYRLQLLSGLFVSVLSARLADVARQPDAPYLAAGAGRGQFVRGESDTTLTALVPNGHVGAALTALLTESARASRYGVTPTEVDRAKENVLAALARAVAEKDTQPSSVFADEFLRHVTTGEPVPGLAYESALTRRLLPAITVADVSAYAASWMGGDDRIVTVVAPRKPGTTPPTAADLTRAIAAAAAAPLTPYVDTVATGPLVPSPPTPGEIARRQSRTDIGLTEWTLSNGVKVVLKPTTYKDDEVLFRAFATGGTSLASDQDFVAAQTAAQVIYAGGAGPWSAADLQKALAGKTVRVQPFIGQFDEGLAGGATRHDLETMFQLMYLRFTAPRADAATFGALQTQLRSIVGNRDATPDSIFAQAMERALTQDHARMRAMAPADVARMDLGKSLAFYKGRFADASAFTFVFVGSFDTAQMEPLVTRYLASLPATHRGETWRDVGVRAPAGVVTRTVHKGLEPKSRVGIVFDGPFEYDATHREVLLVVSRVLQSLVVSSLREKLGATYSVAVSASSETIPQAQYRVAIDFTCAPDRDDELIAQVLDDVATLKAQGPPDRLLHDILLGLGREFETASRQNTDLLGQIAARYETGEDPATFFNQPSLLARITSDAVREAAIQYLDTSRYVQVTLLPERSGPLRK